MAGLATEAEWRQVAVWLFPRPARQTGSRAQRGHPAGGPFVISPGWRQPTPWRRCNAGRNSNQVMMVATYSISEARSTNSGFKPIVTTPGGSLVFSCT